MMKKREGMAEWDRAHHGDTMMYSDNYLKDKISLKITQRYMEKVWNNCENAQRTLAAPGVDPAE